MAKQINHKRSNNGAYGLRGEEKMIKWNVNKKDAKTINLIAKRITEKFNVDFLNVVMDITAAHLNGNKLKLAELLNADDFNFYHDVNGIGSHLDRETGELLNCFSPRYSV